MADELVDIYNDAYEKVGTAMKSEARKKGLWVASIHCWIVRPEKPGYVLFQKRGADKTVFPNALDISAAGHYRSGEDIEDGVREISEEVGLEVAFQDLIPLGIKFDVAIAGDNIVREYCHVFLLKRDLAPHKYTLGEDEVEGLVEISIPDGLALFAGEKDQVIARGIEFNKRNGSWSTVSLPVNTGLFIPRTDPYYYKIFIMAERLLDGSKYLAI